MSNVTPLLKSASTYARDLAERVVWTFVLATSGVALAAGPADVLHASFWQSVGVGGLAAVGSLLKGLAAKLVGDPNSASTASGV